MIPAKYYYDDATQDQWQQKKKSKAELKQNKRAKLDPESKLEVDEYNIGNASAQDVMNKIASTAQKVKIPGKPQAPAQEEESSASQENQEESDDGFMKGELVFDDEGNEVHTEQEFKKQAPKKQINAEEKQKKEENLKKLKEKLADRINTLREKRKAPGTKNGGQIKSRSEILAERKRKEELRKQEKLKRKHEQVEPESDSDDNDNNDSDDDKNNDEVLFGNIVFNDGTRVTSDLSRLRNTVEKKKKGPANKDIKAHLAKLEHKKRKLAQMSAEEREKQKDKDQWTRVMAQAEGVKLKDDEKLLKKSLKRKEKQKLKSEIEWKNRKQIVKDTVAARAKRREENLKARKDNKGKKSKKQPKLRKFTGIVNKAAKGGKKRAGFEGSAKSKKSKK